MTSRAEHRRQTLQLLARTAVDVMERDGVDVPLETIADEAGVARRTIYRWVGGREDLLFIQPRLWLEVFDDAIADDRRGTVLDRLRTGCGAVSDHVDADPEPVRRAMALAAEHPQLLRGYADVNRAWIDRLASEVDPAPADRAARMRARLLGAALMGAIDAALAEWVASPGPPPLRELVDLGIDHLAPVLVEPDV